MSWDEGFAVGLAVGKKKFNEPVSPDEWVYPPEWIRVPFPAGKGKAYFLVTLGSDKVHTAIAFKLFCNDDYQGGIRIDWGDGSTPFNTRSVDEGDVIPNVVGHAYSHGSGHVLASGAEQFLVSVTVEDSQIGEDSRAWAIKLYDSNSSPIYAMSVHTDAIRTEGYEIVYPFGTELYLLQYAAFSGDVGKLFRNVGWVLHNVNSLKKVDISSSSTIDELGYSAICWSYGMSDSIVNKLCKDVVKIGHGNFDGCRALKAINLPKCEEIEDAFSDCFGLYKVTAPNLRTVSGSSCFSNCFSMTYFNAGEDFDMAAAKSDGAFRGCCLY